MKAFFSAYKNLKDISEIVHYTGLGEFLNTSIYIRKLMF